MKRLITLVVTIGMVASMQSNAAIDFGSLLKGASGVAPEIPKVIKESSEVVQLLPKLIAEFNKTRDIGRKIELIATMDEIILDIFESLVPLLNRINEGIVAQLNPSTAKQMTEAMQYVSTALEYAKFVNDTLLQVGPIVGGFFPTPSPEEAGLPTSLDEIPTTETQPVPSMEASGVSI